MLNKGKRRVFRKLLGYFAPPIHEPAGLDFGLCRLTPYCFFVSISLCYPIIMVFINPLHYSYMIIFYFGSGPSGEMQGAGLGPKAYAS